MLADGVLIRQVLDNPIGSALKLRLAGWIPRHRRLPHPPGCVTIQVVDSRIGIPRGRAQIFDEFHRAHYRDYEGGGLGLSIVRRIITRHDRMPSPPQPPDGPGSVFEFTLRRTTWARTTPRQDPCGASARPSTSRQVTPG